MTAKKLEDLLAGTLKGLGSRDQAARTKRFAELVEVAGPDWGPHMEPLGYAGGILKIGVDSSAVLQEVVQFHGDPWLARMQDDGSPVKSLKFVLAEGLGGTS